MQKKEVSWKTIPNDPGVYFFLGKRREILYIGKATSLKHRLLSYFGSDIAEKRSILIAKMVTEAVSVEYKKTDSVLEAMLIEANLIRTHKPAYNTRSKDDKTFNYVIFTGETFPRVLVVRGKDLESYTYTHVYGPFPHGALFREALKIIRKLFQFYDTTTPLDAYKNKVHKGKVDFNRQIGLYPEQCTKREYARTIAHIRLFFEGKKDRIIADLEKQMHAMAKIEAFEKAHVYKKKIHALRHIQDISLLKHEVRGIDIEHHVRIEAYDIAHLQGSDMVGAMVVHENGVPLFSAYRTFIIKNCTKAHDTKALQEVLERRFSHREWTLPNIITVDGSVAQRKTAEMVLSNFHLSIPVVSVVKNEHHKPMRLEGSETICTKHSTAILHANAEAHRFAITFHKKRRAMKYH